MFFSGNKSILNADNDIDAKHLVSQVSCVPLALNAYVVNLVVNLTKLQLAYLPFKC